MLPTRPIEASPGYVLGWSNSGFTEQTDFFLDDFAVYTSDPGWDG